MSSVEEYLQANSNFEEAKAKLDEIARLLETFSRQLQKNPETTFFSNLSGDAGLPIDIVMSARAQSYDAHQWPTPMQIQAAIRHRFEAKSRVQSIWGAIPANLRASLVAPKF